MYDGHERTIVYSSLDGSHACVLGVVPSTSPSTDDTLQIRHQAHPASRLSSRRSIRSRGIHRGAEEQLLPFHHLIQFGRISRTPSWTNQRVSSLPSGSIRLPTPPKGTSIGSHPRSNPRPLGRGRTDDRGRAHSERTQSTGRPGRQRTHRPRRALPRDRG